MSMSDAFFGRIFHAKRELVPFGTVSLTTYFHVDAGRSRRRGHHARARRSPTPRFSTRAMATRTANCGRRTDGCSQPRRKSRISRRREHQRSSVPAVRSFMSDFSEPNQPRIALLGVPIEIGAAQAGTLMGPDALRTAGIARLLEQLEFSVEDHGNLARPAVDSGRPAARQRQILRRGQSLDSHAQRARLFAGALRRRADLHGRRSFAVDGIGQRRRALLAGKGPPAVRAVARCACRLQHAGHDPDRQHARHVGGVPVRRTRPRSICSATSRALRSRRISSTCSASARSIRWKRSWCTAAASRLPTCARSTSSASAC